MSLPGDLLTDALRVASASVDSLSKTYTPHEEALKSVAYEAPVTFCMVAIRKSKACKQRSSAVLSGTHAQIRHVLELDNRWLHYAAVSGRRTCA